MAIKVLLDEGQELRIRITGESHTALQLFRSRLNDHKDVDYANYFIGHPELDEPEFYLRVNKGKNPSKILQTLCKDITKEFDGLTLPK
ncbi:MAG: DNA-directed RNA polymerase subunit L [Candidatus Thalassarchaeaceae archaeon]|jgi:DNA-directed RNA polymerase subunit L|nr:DNA-directed RNA polymerase subunit L [Candidatus Thalassarchaeaceae archaeon]